MPTSRIKAPCLSERRCRLPPLSFEEPGGEPQLRVMPSRSRRLRRLGCRGQSQGSISSTNVTQCLLLCWHFHCLNRPLTTRLLTNGSCHFPCQTFYRASPTALQGDLRAVGAIVENITRDRNQLTLVSGTQHRKQP